MHELKKKDFGRPVYSKLNKLVMEIDPPKLTPCGGKKAGGSGGGLGYYKKPEKWELKDDGGLLLE